MSKIKSDLKIQKFKSRFLVISIFFILTTSISWFLTYNTDHFLTAVKVSSFGLVIWIMFEFDLLKESKVYLMLFTLSLVLAIIGYYLLEEKGADIWIRSTKASLCYLIIYKVLRYFYILIYKREPKLEKSGGLMADRMFSFILVAGSVFTTMSI
ncbi:hypothetical protein [Winogradskyella sp. MH6]|uniref:hypothetical protein n=1 Tax=Winogradskyella sp. MH6 TaxID=2929510 RepID=UPI001FB1D59D|nr:hypothetical protein [Winogradskyella sp. MH6]